MEKIQLEMLLFLVLYGVCLMMIGLIIHKRFKGNKSAFDWVIIAAAMICIFLGAALGVMITSVG